MKKERMTLSYRLLLLMAVGMACMTTACKDDDPTENGQEEEKRVTTDEIYAANKFAYALLDDIYLWKKEVAGDIGRLDADTNTDPIATVSEIRYKQDGKEVDKWSVLTDDVESLTNSTQGINTTYGYRLALGKFTNTDNYFFLVNLVYADSPAYKAGLKRGDIILSLNGQDITKENYLNAVYSSNVTLGMGQYADGYISALPGSVQLTAVTMYTDPILVAKTFDCGGKKVAYLAYDSFDLISASRLVDVCRTFKQEGVRELIIDLRYNGGGYVFTELTLASMLAPEAQVTAKSVYQTEVWNDEYMAYFKSQGTDLNTYFGTAYRITVNDIPYTVNTTDANLGLDKIYALIGSGTASASEALLVGLMPYMPVETIGTQSHGKYCTGMVFEPEDVFTKEIAALKNWGFYVMINRYGDCRGNNPCMPDGLVPDVSLKDNPLEGYPLGDERESLLRCALERAGKRDIPQTRMTSVPEVTWCEQLANNPLDGKRIRLSEIPLHRLNK